MQAKILTRWKDHFRMGGGEVDLVNIYIDMIDTFTGNEFKNFLNYRFL